MSTETTESFPGGDEETRFAADEGDEARATDPCGSK
jgi:hypothetical protein